EEPQLGEVGARAGDGAERSLGRCALSRQGERGAEPEIAKVRIRESLLQRGSVKFCSLGIVAVAVIGVAQPKRDGAVAAGKRGGPLAGQGRPILGGALGR